MTDIFHSGTLGNATNAMKAIEDTAVYVAECMAHRIQLSLKNSIGGEFITASDQIRGFFSEDLHNEDVDDQLDVFERLINMDPGVEDIQQQMYDSAPIEALIRNIARRAAFFNKSTVAADAQALAQEKADESVKRLITSSPTCWLSWYKMSKRNDLIDPVLKSISDDPRENGPGGLWHGEDGKVRERNYANELVMTCKFALGKDSLVDVVKVSGTPDVIEQYSVEHLTPEIRSLRRRLRDCLHTYFEHKPDTEMLVHYYLHPLDKEMNSLVLSTIDTLDCKNFAKDSVSKRTLKLLKTHRK
ncbi:hypothetical protein SARC_02176 [Sphaeroforma arctica JP610]|uniref:Uncharacterized protein n=1 Tax=Sphaeroforma arctica JP610 TaxID=667725 RepID=A0A0L0G9I4_9EUKA|nr:hypothetical protein SARC_02176 [Sphaeroforma arctica JP610]KNC85655.1 hypothetical protein SARC_02176 [Sphaeroforma arctica JP610]|eukprot:XP_014159557.1 hypothetical protein SARC_02176 [Sphaeroforma arctica JP610]